MFDTTKFKLMKSGLIKCKSCGTLLKNEREAKKHYLSLEEEN